METFIYLNLFLPRRTFLLGSDMVGGKKWNYALEHSAVYLYIGKMAARRLDSNQE